jgi:hypothetical protein
MVFQSIGYGVQQLWCWSFQASRQYCGAWLDPIKDQPALQLYTVVALR